MTIKSLSCHCGSNGGEKMGMPKYECDQNERERIVDEFNRGIIDKDEANIRLILGQRVRVVLSPIPRYVRNALNKAVEDGRLGHIAKDGHKPEVYFRIADLGMALESRDSHERAVLMALRSVLSKGADYEQE